MKLYLKFFKMSFIVSAVFMISAIAFGQPAEIPFHIEAYHLESGFYDGNGILGSSPVNVFTGTVTLNDAPWMALLFTKANLGKESYMIIKSLQDNLWAKLDAVSIEQWQYQSAFFNGNAVEISLFAAPLDQNIFFRIDDVIAGEWADGYPESICGTTDDRELSNDPAAGRLLNVGCTGWIIPNGKIVSAGHCLSNAGTVNTLQFNVPPSLPNGTLQHPGPEDQYAADVSTRVFVNGGVGNDWGVFEVFPNSVTGLLPKQAQNAFFYLMQDLGPDSIRITGYGTASGVRNQVQQTHVGPNAGSSGTTMRYRTDTTGGNSGSPVIDAATGLAVGVHTHGGCTSTGGNNNGTSLFNTAFWTAVDEGAGGCPVEPASNPSPANNSTNVSINLAELTWTNGSVLFRVNFILAPTPPLFRLYKVVL
jgi:trimeric autotransporter adhesin